jgi:hypothetical protein
MNDPDEDTIENNMVCISQMRYEAKESYTQLDRSA